MKRLLALIVPLLFVACGDSPYDPIQDEPGLPLTIHAQAIELSDDDVLLAEVSWVAQNPYTHHSVYYGVHDGSWSTVIVDSVPRGSSVPPRPHPIESVIEIPLTTSDQPGFLCIVAWNQGLWKEACKTDVIWPAVPGTPSEIEIKFNDQPPPWTALHVVPDSIKLENPGDEAYVVAVLESDTGQNFMCVRLEENGLRGWIEVVRTGNSIEEIYVAQDYDWYTQLDCQIEFTTTDPQIATVENAHGVVSLYMIPTPAQSILAFMSPNEVSVL